MTLAVFSGINDPHWVIEPNQELAKLFAQAHKAQLLFEVDNMPPRLGYKGFIVQDDQNEFLVLGSRTTDLQELLFMSIPKGLLPNKVYHRVLTTIKDGTVQPVDAEERRKRYAPPFNRDPWRGRHKKHNNCYNYATQRRTDTFAQPGRGSGAVYAAVTKERIRAAAINDGLVVVANGNTPAGARHVVALVVEDCKYQLNLPIHSILQTFYDFGD